MRSYKKQTTRGGQKGQNDPAQAKNKEIMALAKRTTNRALLTISDHGDRVWRISGSTSEEELAKKDAGLICESQNKVCVIGSLERNRIAERPVFG